MHYLDTTTTFSPTEFRAESLRGHKGVEESMSRKIFKKIVFLLLFGAATMGTYTFFSGIAESDKRSGVWKGLVNNMYIETDIHRGQTVSQDKYMEKKPGLKIDKDNPKFNGNDGDIPAFFDVKENQINEHRGPIKEEAKPKDINVRDKSGKVVGQKLFAFGMSKDDIANHKYEIDNKDHGSYNDVAENRDNNVLESFHDNIRLPDNDQRVNNVKNDPIQNRDNNVLESFHDNIRLPDNDQRVNNDKNDPIQNNIENDDGERRDGDESDSFINDGNNQAEQQPEKQREEERIIRPIEKENGNEFNNMEKQVDINEKPDVSVRDQNGHVVGHKLFPFGMRPGRNSNQDELSAHRVHNSIDSNPKAARAIKSLPEVKKNVRPDSAFFDDKGNIKKGDSEMNGMSDFQQRMGLRNPFLKHNYNVNDPFNKHKARFRSFGANGINPAVADTKDKDGKNKPVDAFAGINLKGIWDSMPKKLPSKPQPNVNPVSRGFGSGLKPARQNPVPSLPPQNHLLNNNNQKPPPRGQLMGYDNGKSNQNNNNNEMLNRNSLPNGNLPRININGANSNNLIGFNDGSNGNKIGQQQFGNGIELSNNKLPVQNRLNNPGVMGNNQNQQLIGYNNRQNQFIGQQNAAWNHQNAVGFNNNINNINANQNQRQNNAYALNGNNNNINNNPFGQGFGQNHQQQQQQQNLIGLQNRFNGNNNNNINLNGNVRPVSNNMHPFNPQQNGGQLMGLQGSNGGVRKNINNAADQNNQLGQGFPSRVQKPIKPISLVTSAQKHLEQQIVKPINNNDDGQNNIAIHLPSVNQNVKVENTNEEEEELFLTDLTKPLTMTADCKLFTFPSGEGSLCIPKPDGDGTALDLKETGTWEPTSMKQFGEILLADPSMSVIDIGAGIGVYTIAAALLGRKVVAVEPLEFNYKLLHQAALENKVASNIVMVTQALDKESYIGHIVQSKEAGGFSKVRIEHLATGDEKESADNVHVTTLDKLVRAIPFKKALLKLDVGGRMEADILNAGLSFFKSIDIPFIMTHWNNDIDINNKIQIAAKMAQLGYKPKLHWDGPPLDPNSLHFAMDYLVWHKQS